MLAITGGSGQLGRAVASELLTRATPNSVRFGTRSPDTLAAFRSAGAHVSLADFDDPGSLRSLFEGCDVALIISGDAPNDKRIAQHAAAFQSAKSVGVRRIVYTSFANPVADSRFLVAPSHLESERMLHNLGLAFTILRNNCYAENIMIEAARATGELVQPGSTGRVAYVSRADVARAAVAAMTGSGHENKTYEITGPEALDHFEIADRLSRVWRRPILVRNISTEAYAGMLRGRGAPPFIVHLLVSLHDAIASGEYAKVSSDAKDIIGGPIESASDFLARS